MKKIALISASILIVANVAYADFVANIQSLKTLKGEDACDVVAGHWIGGGSITAQKNKDFTCNYGGFVDIANIPQSKTLKVHIDLSFKSGSYFCPPTEAIDLPGTCSNGKIVLKTENADLGGNINSAGNHVDINGTVAVAGPFNKTVFDVKDMKLDK